MPIPEKVKTLEELANEVRSLAETTAEHSKHWENFEQIVLSYFWKIRRMPRENKMMKPEENKPPASTDFVSGYETLEKLPR